MTLGAPLGLLALGALLPLAAAYFLRRKQPPRAVSALFLWRSKDLRAEAGPRFERFSREVSLALEALAVVMAALYLSDARWGADARLRHLVVVVDGSLSMRARVPGGEEVAGRVRAAVARLARTQGAGVLTVISSGLSPTVVAGPSLETARALALLETWSPAQPHHDLAPALLLARELATAKGQHITLFTDGPLPAGFSLPPQVEVRGLGTPLDNVGLLSAHRRDADGKAVVAVRVGSFAAAARSVVVRFATESGPVETKVVDLAAGASAALRVVIQTQASVEVSLPEDALVEDGRVTLGPAPEQEVAVALLDGLEPSAASAVRRFVDAASGVRLEAEGPLTFGPPGSSARVKLGARGSLRSFVGPFFAQRGSGLLDDVQLGGVVWTAGENPPGRPLVSAGDAVLVSEEEDGALHFNLALSRSNAQRTAAWPVLLGNVVRLTRLGLPGLPRRLLVDRKSVV